MENNEMENILEESKKSKNNKKIPLIIIGILLVILIGVGVFFYFKMSNTQNIYYEIIDNFAEFMGSSLNENLIDKPVSYNAKASFDLQSNNSEIKNIAKILNNVKVELDVESDFSNKLANMNLSFNYKNKGNVNANLYVDNDSIYANLKDLYDKPIKVITDDSVSEIWKTGNNKNNKIIIEEFSKELKKSLKDEYFEKTEETIDIMNNKVNVVKHTLALEKSNLNKFKNDLINNIEKNEKLVNAIIETSDMDKDTFIDSLEEVKNDNTLESYSFVSNIYIKKGSNELEKLEFILTENDIPYTVVYNKVDDNKYEIISLGNNIGTLLIEENKLEFNIDYEGVKAKIEYSKKSDDVKLLFNFDSGADKVEFSVTNSSNKGNLAIIVDSKTADIKLNANIDFEQKDISSVSKMDVSKSVNIESMSSNDMNSIITKLYQNQAIMEFIKDIQNV